MFCGRVGFCWSVPWCKDFIYCLMCWRFGWFFGCWVVIYRLLWVVGCAQKKVCCFVGSGWKCWMGISLIWILWTCMGSFGLILVMRFWWFCCCTVWRVRFGLVTFMRFIGILFSMVFGLWGWIFDHVVGKWIEMYGFIIWEKPLMWARFWNCWLSGILWFVGVWLDFRWEVMFCLNFWVSRERMFWSMWLFWCPYCFVWVIVHCVWIGVSVGCIGGILCENFGGKWLLRWRYCLVCVLFLMYWIFRYFGNLMMWWLYLYMDLWTLMIIMRASVWRDFWMLFVFWCCCFSFGMICLFCWLVMYTFWCRIICISCWVFSLKEGMWGLWLVVCGIRFFGLSLLLLFTCIINWWLAKFWFSRVWVVGCCCCF